MGLGEALNLVEILYLARRKQFLDRSNEPQEISENEICKLEPDEREEIEVECIDQSSSDSRVDFERNSAADGVGGPPFVLRPDFVQKPTGLGSASKPEEIPQPPFMIPPTSTPLYSQHYGDSDKKCRIVHPASKGMG